ncbi:transcription-repair coupling factor [Microaerobacter geothermalis]|uniref:transcription-repair coupling factor n=1 Tax=Microaerobacter geothermalis TaxID=674972 RepID=UPI001F1C27B8|nr:transcription-repair coupling factor [Microaerobacter geothermalis]MCF6094697.1 transcription-repair coupling factor [Microaerobacter geothermalis]
MNPLIDNMIRDMDFQTVAEGINKGLKEQLITGLSGSARHLFFASCFYHLNRSLIVVTHNMFQAQKVYEDLVELLGEEQVVLYPANELNPFEVAAASPESLSQRIAVLNQLSTGKKLVTIVPYAGIRKLLSPLEVWKKSQLIVSSGEMINLEEFVQKLIELGYERVEMVEDPGEVSIRGGIIDIFPLIYDSPIRIELFDDEVDSIRRFDPSNQRSLENVQEIVIPPRDELIVSPNRLQMAADELEKKLSDALKSIKDEEIKERLVEKLGWEIEQLRQGQTFQGLYKYVSLLYPKTETLLDYAHNDTILMIDEPSRVLDVAEQMEKNEREWQMTLLEQGEMLTSISISRDKDAFFGQRKFPVLHFSLFLRQVSKLQPQNIINMISRAIQNFHGQMNVLKGEVERWEKSGYRMVFLAGDEERGKRLERVLNDYGMDVSWVNKDTPLSSRPTVRQGLLQGGFELPGIRLAVVTEGEVFTQKLRKVRKIKQLNNAERIKNYLDLQAGDYVVHVNHGIGKYLGIETLEINGVHKDYLHIKYAGNDKLYVPVEQIDQVQKYVGSEEKEPKIYSLGGSEWKRIKNKVRSSVQDIAADLIKLYAKRESTPGFAFSKDTPDQAQFESLFPYEETPDQLRAIQEVKQDMEKSSPMDRLLCGDVGYGKTEVAIRAAFKAVMDGKQVALLVPTTILAQQHFKTFKERFSEYPIEIDVLSRFRSRKEQTKTIDGLKKGLVDIVIGTHRLLSKDVQFKDLGLLIVDEEQRFGVTHKEKLKKLKANVDVLTLTATPIPRTLHMGMLGVRDLSVIETPPENRFPIQTYVVEFSFALVREAIERELAREGQVYFLYNQVKGIYKMAEQIASLVPEARVAVAHGQMSENELERTMLDFLDGQFDVLVSTTIIETGVDIPNVNTLIIYDADKMGLSQLYQLRGRVGRSNRIAYAYFTYQRDKVLTEVAEKRLQAIKEFTELGSGFKIAMRDLAIRGAGNLLGAEQHGFIASVGFDLYSQMLKEAIEELKGEKAEALPPVEPEISLHVDAYIPAGYITDSSQKIQMYKKIASVKNLEDVLEVEEELLDRFGDPPVPVLNLLQIAKLRAYAFIHRIVKIEQKDQVVEVIFHPDQNQGIDGGKLFALVSKYERRVGLSYGQSIGITVKVKGLTQEEIFSMLDQLFSQLDEVKKQKGELKHAAK